MKILIAMAILVIAMAFSGCEENANLVDNEEVLDAITIESIEWDGDVIEDIEKEFKVTVSYDLNTMENGFIEITFNDGDDVTTSYRKALVPISKGSGTEVIVINVNPVKWDNEPYFGAAAFILNKDEEIIVFSDKTIEVSDLKNEIIFVSVEPLEEVVEGIEVEYKIIVDYSLVSHENAILEILINDGDESNSYILKASESITKGDGTVEYVVKTIPKNWENGINYAMIVIINVEDNMINSEKHVMEF